jgi:hypothetical protein
VTETLTTFRFPESGRGQFPDLRPFLSTHAQFFTGKGNSAVISLLYSAILTRSIQTIKGTFLARPKGCFL